MYEARFICPPFDNYLSAGYHIAQAELTDINIMYETIDGWRSN